MQKLIRSASYLSVTIASIILIAKTYGWFITDSVSILASLVDSMFDISASTINLIAIVVSFSPPDDRHRFGHGKVQDLAIFGQSMFLLGSGLFTMFSAFKNFFLHEEVHAHETSTGIYIMLFSMLMTSILITYQNFVLKKTKAQIIAVDKIHYFMDFLTNAAVVISLYLTRIIWYIDIVLAILIAVYVTYSAYIILRKSLRNLMDEESDKEKKAQILNILYEYKEILGVHELKTRMAGDKLFIQCHLEMDGKKSLFEVHHITDKVIADINKVFTNAEVMIHQDPAGVERNVMYKEY